MIPPSGIATCRSCSYIYTSIDEEEIDLQTSALRKKLTAEANGSNKANTARGLKTHQVHELAAAKIEETERLRKALGIKEDHEAGSHWNETEKRLRGGVEIAREDTREKTREATR